MLRSNEGMVPLRLHVDLGEYGVGELEDSQSAIARPYRRLVEDGSDPGKISYVLISSAPGGPYKMAGAVCETSGQRLLFFPGSRIRRVTSLFNPRHAASAQTLAGIVDHITFEMKSRRAHITEVLPGGRRGVVLKLPRRREVGQRLYAWFGMTLRSVAALDNVPARLWFTAQCPTSDTERRLELFRTAGRASRVCSLPVAQPTSDTFLQVNFFVGLDSGRLCVPIRTFLPKGPPELRTAVRIPATLNAQLYSLDLHDGAGVFRIHPIVWDGEAVNEVALGF
jgi:hypothetical protein